MTLQSHHISGFVAVAITVFAGSASAQSQLSSGDCSPNIGEVTGNVSINCPVGSSYRGGVFLFEEPVEIYWNEWWGVPLKDEQYMRRYHSAELTVWAEGKAVDFVGHIYMNCENSRYDWKAASNFGDRNLTSEEIDELVPRQVTRNIWKLFCRE